MSQDGLEVFEAERLARSLQFDIEHEPDLLTLVDHPPESRLGKLGADQKVIAIIRWKVVPDVGKSDLSSFDLVEIIQDWPDVTCSSIGKKGSESNQGHLQLRLVCSQLNHEFGNPSEVSLRDLNLNFLAVHSANLMN